MGLAMSDLPPSAAMVNATRHTACAPSGNASNALRAEVTQDIGRVGFVIHFEVVIFANSEQAEFG